MGSDRLLATLKRHAQPDGLPELLQSINIETVRLSRHFQGFMSKAQVNTSEEVARDANRLAINLTQHKVESAEALHSLATAYEEV